MNKITAEPVPTLEVEGYLLYRMSVLSAKLSGVLEGYYGPRHGLQRAQWRVLALIASEPDCTASTLVPRASMDAVAVHRAVSQLIDQGLVVRSPSATDGRAKLLRLSAQGQHVYKDISPFALSLESRVLGELTQQQARCFLQALERIEAMKFDGAVQGGEAD